VCEPLPNSKDNIVYLFGKQDKKDEKKVHQAVTTAFRKNEPKSKRK
jgi:hypothetical protein